LWKAKKKPLKILPG